MEETTAPPAAATEPAPDAAEPPPPLPPQAPSSQPSAQPQPSSEAAPPTSSSAPSQSQQEPSQPPTSQTQTLTPTFLPAQQQRPALAVTRPPPPYSPAPPIQRGGVAIGVPAHGPHHPRPHQPPSPFSAYTPSQPFGGLPRGPIGVSEQSPNSGTQVRQPVQGIQTIGMIGSLSSGSPMRPSGIPAQLQPRPGQPLRSASATASQNLSNQKFQGHGLARGPSMPSPSSPSPSPQSTQPGHHQWMSAQGRQIHGASLASSSFRPQIRPQVLQNRPNLPQHQHTLLMNSHQQQISSSQQQQQQQQKHQQQQLQQVQQQQTQVSQPHQSLEHHSQLHPASRNQLSLQQQQGPRGLGTAPQNSNIQASFLPSAAQPGVMSPLPLADVAETGNQILSKRSIRELVAQIDPAEKLDPEVEDVLVEIADDFIESITTFACSLAKHRKSTMLEGKDILLHAERNWNMTLPGFSGDEIKCYKKPFTNDIHKERLAAIKKSMMSTSDSGNAKHPASGQAAANPKGHVAKTPAAGSPKA